jgi:hypothetical protein
MVLKKLRGFIPGIANAVPARVLEQVARAGWPDDPGRQSVIKLYVLSILPGFANRNG